VSVFEVGTRLATTVEGESRSAAQEEHGVGCLGLGCLVEVSSEPGTLCCDRGFNLASKPRHGSKSRL